ncbi:hypothetical protein [Halomontanus rarus]|nr:hypothetical protein [Halovivax sp. TS33]
MTESVSARAARHTGVAGSSVFEETRPNAEPTPSQIVGGDV